MLKKAFQSTLAMETKYAINKNPLTECKYNFPFVQFIGTMISIHNSTWRVEMALNCFKIYLEYRAIHNFQFNHILNTSQHKR